MLRHASLKLIACCLALSACVTINVYFPAAAAEKAADKIIEDVWGGDKSSESDTKREDNKQTAVREEAGARDESAEREEAGAGRNPHPHLPDCSADDLQLPSDGQRAAM